MYFEWRGKVGNRIEFLSAEVEKEEMDIINSTKTIFGTINWGGPPLGVSLILWYLYLVSSTIFWMILNELEIKKMVYSSITVIKTYYNIKKYLNIHMMHGYIFSFY